MVIHTHTHGQPAAKDCPNDQALMPAEFSLPSQIIKLKSMNEFRPEVTKDLTAIVDKFPCHDIVRRFLGGFVSKEN